MYFYLSNRNTALKANAKQATTLERNQYNAGVDLVYAAINNANQNLYSPEENLRQFNEGLAMIDQAEANMKYEATNNPQTWLNNQDELKAIANFRANERDFTIRRMQFALSTPNPEAPLYATKTKAMGDFEQ